MRLGVNVDHVATVREARRGTEPDPVTAALLAEEAGADLITVHLREDRRHIQDRDVRLLRELVKTHLNLEMAPAESMVPIAVSVRPDSVTLVPEKREELTTEGGLNVQAQNNGLSDAIRRLREAGIRVSLFIDPDLEQVKESLRVGAQAIEVHTGRYANAAPGDERRTELEKVADSAALAAKIGLDAVAGHGLDYRNIGAVARIPDLSEVNIGHAIVARALSVGMKEAVSEMVARLR